VVNIVLVFKSKQKAGSYLLASTLLVNVLSIHANDTNNANNVDNVNNVNNTDDADLAKTLLPTTGIALGTYEQVLLICPVDLHPS
jgi:hypothetical protein